MNYVQYNFTGPYVTRLSALTNVFTIASIYPFKGLILPISHIFMLLPHLIENISLEGARYLKPCY